MAVDLTYLREHYASLSDEALAAIQRAELVEAAQRCYDEEVARRKHARASSRRSESADEDAEGSGGDAAISPEPLGADEKPDWLEDGVEVLSRADRAGSAPSDDIADAREVLEDAGIACYLELSEIPEESDSPLPPTHLWRLMVPGNLNLLATSILERDIFNAEFEAGWRIYLETLSPEELSELDPKEALCGLFDRVERVNNAYEEELRRRK